MVEQLAPRRVVVVGAGGVGGWLLQGLGMMLEYRAPGSVLMVIDGDNYEPKNAERQNFTEMGNKAIAKAAELQPQFPRTFVIPQAKWVVETVDGGEENNSQITATSLLNEGDVVYSVVDNYAARKVIFDAAKQFENIDVFTGGNDDNLYGSVYHYQRREGREVTEHPVEWHPEFVDPPDRNPGEMSCQERAEFEGGSQLIATNMAVAAYLLGRTEKIILQDEPDHQAEIFFDLGVGLAQAYDRSPENETVSAVTT
jgi:hypothetical protein